MNIVSVPMNLRTDGKIASLLRLWEASVRETHLFLCEQDILSLRPCTDKALRGINHLFTVEKEDGKPAAFMGMEGTKIEMLFVAPEQRGRGIGKKLLRYAADVLNAEYVDVNEQNPQAAGFYEHCGFSVFGRSEKDADGRPFPLLHMKKTP
ncbi:MAG: GNAT family N-acetyltransferase [Alphaproteobacteria bacterium]|jgi:putative acetyltransferase